MTSEAVVLIGPPGAGKTTTGRILARQLHWDFADSDALIEKRAECSISDIFVQQGESAFRALERACCAELLAHPRGVISLGGGAVLNPDTAAQLASLPVIFLDVSIADAAGRVGFSTSRPLLAVNPRAQWTALMNTRRPLYERLASHRVDTAERKPEQVATEIHYLLDPQTPLPDPPPRPQEPS